MNREQRRRSSCSKHKGRDGKTWVIAWSCPTCWDERFSDRAKDAKQELLDIEIETGMRAALVCFGCAKSMAVHEGWELIDDPDAAPHNQYMLFCPHEEGVSSV